MCDHADALGADRVDGISGALAGAFEREPHEIARPRWFDWHAGDFFDLARRDEERFGSAVAGAVLEGEKVEIAEATEVAQIAFAQRADRIDVRFDLRRRLESQLLRGRLHA